MDTSTIKREFIFKGCLLTKLNIFYIDISLQHGSVAQSVEQWPFKPLVPGSSPGRPTIVVFSKVLCGLVDNVILINSIFR